MPRKTPQKPPDPIGLVTGLPYQSGWEEIGAPWDELFRHGVDRSVIDLYFKLATKAGAPDLAVTKKEIRSIVAPLRLPRARSARLTDDLYYMAGKIRLPALRAHFGETLPKVRARMKKLGTAAAKAHEVMAALGPTESRFLRAAKLRLGKGDPRFSLTNLQDQLADLALAAGTMAAEMPQLGPGTTVDTLRGGWLRQSAAIFEQATGQKLETKANDNAGKKFRLVGVSGEVFEKYCRRAGRGKVAAKTIVDAVRDFQKHGLPRPPS